MAFAKWKSENQLSAIAIVAISAIDERKNSLKDDEIQQTIANIATIAIAASENQKKSELLPPIENLSKSPAFGGSNSVISANQPNNTPPIEERPYTKDELDRVLNQAAEPLYFHLVTCTQCCLEDARYCVKGFALGSSFDCLLLCFDDANAIRYKLMNQVIKARVWGRKRFEPLERGNTLPQPQNAPIPHKYGNTPDYEAFINHWTACQTCKPMVNRYCTEGQRLKGEADSSQ